MQITKKQYMLEGIDCVNCVGKIEAEIVKLPDIISANIDFVSQKLFIEMQNYKETTEKNIKQIIAKYEPDINVKEIIYFGEHKVIYLGNLSCAECSKKIENKVKEIKDIKNANIDFVSQKLFIEIYEKNMPSVLKEVVRMINDIEPGVTVSFIDLNKNKKSSKPINKNIKIRIVLSLVLFLSALILNLPGYLEFSLFVISYLLAGCDVLLKSVNNIRKGNVFDENFLMSIATIGAFAIGEYPEGVAVMLFYQVGEIFQNIAVNRSRKSISELMDIRPDYANLKTKEGIKKVSPEEVAIGDIIVVKPGEKVPLDAIVIEGSSALDMSALTGESLLLNINKGSAVLSGSVNKHGFLHLKVTNKFENSTVSKILDLVQNANAKKAYAENFITKFAKYYTPIVVFTALFMAVIPLLLIEGALFTDWINRALIFLVISCPCALVISIPLSFFGGIGGASKNGILIKGSNYLEALNNIDTIVFDKTGTLTKGSFKVTEVKSSSEFNQDDILFFAAYAEIYSLHPIALSIQKAYRKKIDSEKIKTYEELAGLGVKITIENKLILAGNHKLLDNENITYKKIDSVGTVVYVAINKKFAGYITISDELKPDSKQTIIDLKNIGIKNIIMFTGDNKTVAEKIASDLGIDNVYSELLPHQKVEKLEALEKEKITNGKLVFVGDGINDAPVIARSDIGIAMGALGSDAAIEAADIVLMTDDPSKVVTAIKIAKNTRNIVWQNIIFALGVKGIILALGATGIATMWEAVFADVGVTLIAIINASRAIKKIN